MPKNDFLYVGDKIDLTFNGRRFYKTMIGDIYKSGLVLVSPPIYRGVQMSLDMLAEVYLVCYRESGRYTILTRVVGFEEKSGIRYTILERLTEPEKNQRREFYRLSDSVEAVLYEYIAGIELTLDGRTDVPDAVQLAVGRTKDISAMGAALLSKWECRLGERYLIKMLMKGPRDRTDPFMVCGEVRRSALTSENGIYYAGMRFFGLTKEKNEYLQKYILTQQQKIIAQKKLVEGE
ncbi:MAG: flagellar brake protein [Oscillospiraceae bacterium]|nr:flagellar brake protein [Oscillospiraceae bacterium]